MCSVNVCKHSVVQQEVAIEHLGFILTEHQQDEKYVIILSTKLYDYYVVSWGSVKKKKKKRSALFHPCKTQETFVLKRQSLERSVK
jgi:hypothetical protein